MATQYLFSSIASLKAQSYTGLATGDQAEVTGYYAAADGGGGLFTYDSSSSATDDGGAVILSTGNTGNGRWLRVMAGLGGSGGPAGAVSVKWWGAKGNNVSTSPTPTNNVTAFNAAIAYAYALLGSQVAPGTVYIPSGTYYINGTVSILGGNSGTVSIYGEGPTNTYIKACANNFSMFQSLPSDGSGNVQRWSFKRMSIDGGGGGSFTGVICLDLFSNTSGSGSTSRGVLEEVIFWWATNSSGTPPTHPGYGLKVHGIVNSYRDCQAVNCSTGFYLGGANGCMMERCEANGALVPIQVASGAGLFINAVWEGNSGPMLLDAASGVTLYNCYTESNGTAAGGFNTQLLVGMTTACTNITIIGGQYFGGNAPTSPTAYNQYVFEMYNVDGYSFINPSASSGSLGGGLFRAGPSTASAGVVSFFHMNGVAQETPDASVADQLVNYFPNPNFDNWLAGYGGVSVSNCTMAQNTDPNFVKYGPNSIKLTGMGASGNATLQIKLPQYLSDMLQGRYVRAVALVKAIGPSYNTSNPPGAVPSIDFQYLGFSGGWSGSYVGTNWWYLVGAPGTVPNPIPGYASPITVEINGSLTSTGGVMQTSDNLYVDSIWIVPGNLSLQSLMAGNIATLDCAKWPVYRTNAGTPVSVLTPNFIGEEVLDTSGSAWYKAVGTGSANWQAL